MTKREIDVKGVRQRLHMLQNYRSYDWPHKLAMHIMTLW